jgi:hypothetical protein
MKKGQGLPLNTIIIAAIVLIVLVVLWAIFTGRMGTFSTGVKNVENCKDACTALGRTEDQISGESIGPVGGVDCKCSVT